MWYENAFSVGLGWLDFVWPVLLGFGEFVAMGGLWDRGIQLLFVVLVPATEDLFHALKFVVEERETLVFKGFDWELLVNVNTLREREHCIV